MEMVKAYIEVHFFCRYSSMVEHLTSNQAMRVRSSLAALMITLENAIKIACVAHEGQVDKLGHPYILHPLRVMMSFKPHESDERIVGVFHDTIEDSHLTLNYLQANGVTDKQALAIDLLTHRKYQTREEYVKLIMTNPLALKVKIADIHDNLSRIEYLEIETQTRLKGKYAKDLALIYSA